MKLLSVLSLVMALGSCGKPRKAFPRKGPNVDELEEILGDSSDLRPSYHDRKFNAHAANGEFDQQVIISLLTQRIVRK